MKQILLSSSPDPSFIIRKCRINNIPFVFDSAASCSVVPSRYFTKFHGEKKCFSWISDDIRMESQGKVTLNLDFGQPNSLSWQFHALENINFGLIGMDFMKTYNVILYPKSKMVIFKDIYSSSCSEGEKGEHRNAPLHQKNKSKHKLLNMQELNLKRRQLKKSEMLSDSDLSDDNQTNATPPPSKIRSDASFPFVEELQSTSDEESAPIRIPVATQIENLPGIPEVLKQILLRFRESFDPELTAHKSVPGFKFDIIVTDDKPFYHKARMVPIRYQRKLRRLLRKYVKHKIITPAMAAQYVSALQVVAKKDGNIRLCIDLRVLNARSVPLKGTIPSFDTLLMKIHQMDIKFCTTIDISEAFFNIECTERAKKYLVFSTIFGMFRLERMSQGSSSSSEVFQSILNVLFQDLDFVIIFIDDLIIASASYELHLQHIKAVLQILNRNNFTINLKKCHFFKKNVEFLGYNISTECLTPTSEKCVAIKNMALPETHSDLRGFLGAFNFNRRFVHNAAGRLDPLYKMVDPRHKRKKLLWTSELISAFNDAKRAMDECVKLSYFDPTKQIVVITDASDLALSGVLIQCNLKIDETSELDGKFPDSAILQMYSRPFKITETKYSIYLKELLAIRDSLRYFHPIIYGRDVKILSDNRAVTNLLTLATNVEFKARIHRIYIEILQYAPSVYYIGTKQNFLCDMLSRNCVTQNKINCIAAHRSLPQEGTIHNSPCILGLIRKAQVDTDLIALANEQKSDPWILGLSDRRNQGTLELKWRRLEGTDLSVLGDYSTGLFRLIIPKALRHRFLVRSHNKHHSGVRRSTADITSECVWPGIKADTKVFVKACHVCARSKIHRHEKTALIKWVGQRGKFETIQADYIGPLQPDNDYRYILAIKDRATRFTVLVAMKTQTHGELIHALTTRWIQYMGIPAQITTDNAKVFWSRPLQDVLDFFGITFKPVNCYRPSENALIERSNRITKALLRTSENKENWALNLPLVNLYVNNLIGRDGSSAAQCTYGRSLYTPGKIFEEPPPEYDSAAAKRMMEFCRKIKDTPFSEHPATQTQDLSLQSSTHVFLRVDKRISALDMRYSGPYMVLRMGTKSAIISKDDKPCKVSRDRLKPCHFLPLDLEDLNSILKDIHPITDTPIDKNLPLDADIGEVSEQEDDENARTQNIELSSQLPMPPPPLGEQDTNDSSRRIRRTVRHYGSNIYDV